MSYPPVQNNYGNTGASRSSQVNYQSTREPLSNPQLYSGQTKGTGDERQVQYHNTNYDWSSQNQQTYTNNGQQGYGNDWWRDGNQNVSYEYQRQASTYTTAGVVSNTHACSNPMQNHYSQDTQGLNNLAYASVLDSTSRGQPSLQIQTPSETLQPMQSSRVRPSSRTESPANRIAQRPVKSPQGAISYPMQNDRSSDSASSQVQARNAAAALASAVNHRYSTTPQQSHQSATSNVVPVSRPNVSTRNTRLQSGPANSSDATIPARQPLSQRQTASNRRSYAATSASITSPTTSANTSSQRSVKSNMAARVMEPEHSRAPQAIQRATSISNLISAANEPDQTTSQGAEMVQEPMPSYIDPAAIFNPYQREREIKRAAAELESRRKLEEAKRVEEQRKLEQEAAKQTQQQSTAPTNETPTIPPKNTELKNCNMSTNAVSIEEAMATEMRQMMDKIKEFRTKDPSLFQKLWNDMKKDNSNSSNAHTVQSPSPQMSGPAPLVTPNPPSAVSHQVQSGKQEKTSSSAHPLNGYKVVVENNAQGLPDLGRFPAERRIRQPQKLKEQNDAALSAGQADDKTSAVPPKATQNQSRNTHNPWPEPRRRAIAIAAVHFMKRNPANASIAITAQEICNILEQNPSYIDLCTALENRGFKFQRNEFARDLLHKVPDLYSMADTEKTKRAMTTSLSTIAALTPNTVAHAPPSTSSQTAVAPPQIVVSQEQNIPLVPVVKPEQPQPALKAARGRPPTAFPGRPEPPAGTKEAAAKKRDFSELIDLTSLRDNEDYVLSRKEPRLDFAQSTPNSQPSTLQQQGPGQSSQPTPSYAAGTFSTSSSTVPIRFDTQAQPANMSTTQTYPGAYGPAALMRPGQSFSQQPVPQQRPKTVLAKRINLAEALSKLFHDPRTVARDILIASGRHPSEPPLNGHLNGLLLKYLNPDSDLATLDWDAIDPGGPPFRMIDFVDVPAVQPKIKHGRKRTRLPEMPSTAEAHEPEGKCDFRSTQVQPSSPDPVSAPSPAPQSSSRVNGENRRASRVSNARSSFTTNDGRKPSVSRPATPQTSRISVDINIGNTSNKSARPTARSTERPVMENTPNTSVKRRGRPPGAKNKNPSVATLRQRQQQQEQPTPIKHNITNMPLKAPSPPSLSFRCKWIHCKADLHNLETLQRHVLKVHVPSQKENEESDGWICWWKNCKHLKPDEDGKIYPAYIYDDPKGWSEHIKRDHIHAVAMKYGDGPTSHIGKPVSQEFNFSEFLYVPSQTQARTSSHTDAQKLLRDRERYLSDEDGRSVTPSVSLEGNLHEPEDALVLTRIPSTGPKSQKEQNDIAAQVGAKNAFLKAHGSRDVRKGAEEILRAMAVRKEKIGPGIDRGGCTLINEERRSTFVQSPGIARVVDFDY